jgi:hypothetical protein
MISTRVFTQRRRAILATLLAVPSVLISGFTLGRQRTSGEVKRTPSQGTITVSIHPHAVARVKRREPTHR